MSNAMFTALLVGAIVINQNSCNTFATASQTLDRAGNQPSPSAFSPQTQKALDDMVRNAAADSPSPSPIAPANPTARPEKFIIVKTSSPGNPPTQEYYLWTQSWFRQQQREFCGQTSDNWCGPDNLGRYFTGQVWVTSQTDIEDFERRHRVHVHQ